MKYKNYVIGFVIGVVLALGMWGVVQAVEPTPTVTPKAVLSYSKTASPETEIGGIISFSHSVTNIGNKDSDSQTAVDTLPGGVDWWIVSDSWGCTLAPSSTVGRTVLRCGDAIVQRRHLNQTEDDFVNGVISVTVFGQAYQCGSYFNTAVFNGLMPSNPAIAYVKCPATPTPVATATPVPPTPTVVAPTQTPQIVYVEVTPTPKPVVVPKPPATGNSVGSDSGIDWGFLWIVSAIAVIILMVVAKHFLGNYEDDTDEEH